MTAPNVNVNEMTEAARKKLGWARMTSEEAAGFAHVDRRNWLRFKPGAKGHKEPPRAVVLVFWYEVGLSMLAQADHEGGEAAVEALVGGPLTPRLLSSFFGDLWAPWVRE